MIWSAIATAAMMQQPGASPYIQPRVEQRAPKVVPQAPRGSTSIRAEGVGEPIRGIIFEGVEAPSQVAEAAQAFIGRPASKETLVELAGALSRAYERTNIALYTVSIPEQDFSDGVVAVTLAEGSVEHIEVKGAAADAFPLLRRQANKVLASKPLERSLYERQSALIQGIPGLKLQESFDNPNDGDEVIWVLEPTQKRVEAASAINNRGPELLGDLVLNAGVDFYKLITDGDQLSLTGAATPNFRNYRAVEASYGLPIGADGLRVTGTAAWVATRARNFDIKGRAKLAGVSLTYPVLRRATRAADISFSVDGVNARNAVFGNIIATERTRAARLSGAFVSASSDHTFNLSGNLSHGLDILGARISDPDTEIAFNKFNASSTYERTWASRFIGRLHVSGQYSRDRLPAAELLSVGGALIGRAFDTGILTGDRGIGGFAELAVRPIQAGSFAQSEAYLFGDAARLTVEERTLSPETSFGLASGGAGVRARYKDRVQLGVEAAAVIDEPYAGYDDKWRLSFYYSLAL